MKRTVHGVTIKTFLILLGILSVAALIYYSGISNYITLAYLQQQSSFIKEFVEHNYIRAVFYYIIIFTLLTVTTLPVLIPFALLGGFLFGVFPGFLYALICSTAGAIFSVLIIRYCLSSFMRDRYKEKLENFDQKIKAYGYSYMLTLQLLLMPFVVVNTLAALTNMPTFTVFWTTVLGSTPLTFICVLAGRNLGTIASAEDILSPEMIALLVLCGVITLIPMLIKKFKHHDA